MTFDISTEDLQKLNLLLNQARPNAAILAGGDAPPYLTCCFAEARVGHTGNCPGGKWQELNDLLMNILKQ